MVLLSMKVLLRRHVFVYDILAINIYTYIDKLCFGYLLYLLASDISNPIVTRKADKIQTTIDGDIFNDTHKRIKPNRYTLYS